MWSKPFCTCSSTHCLQHPLHLRLCNHWNSTLLSGKRGTSFKWKTHWVILWYSFDMQKILWLKDLFILPKQSQTWLSADSLGVWNRITGLVSSLIQSLQQHALHLTHNTNWLRCPCPTKFFRYKKLLPFGNLTKGNDFELSFCKACVTLLNNQKSLWFLNRHKWNESHQQNKWI